MQKPLPTSHYRVGTKSITKRNPLEIAFGAIEDLLWKQCR